MSPAKMRIGVLGCGQVSHLYLPNLVETDQLELAAIADLDVVAAESVGARYGVPVVSVDQLVADPSIDLVLNLTPIAAHEATSRRLLESGKHVYSEKSLATTTSEARGLQELANTRGLTLACAPDTLLGSGFSAAKEAISAGAIGRPLFAAAVMVRPELLEPSWYTTGATALLDMAPYYVSALVTLLGSATSVTASARLWPAGAAPQVAEMGAPVSASAMIDFASGATASLTLAWGSVGHDGEFTRFDVYGTTGVANLPNPNNFGDPAFSGHYGAAVHELPGSQQPERWRGNLRGLGVIEMANAIEEGRAPRCDSALAVHVVEIINAIEASASSHQAVAVTTTATIAPLLNDAERERLLSAIAN